MTAHHCCPALSLFAMLFFLLPADGQAQPIDAEQTVSGSLTISVDRNGPGVNALLAGDIQQAIRLARRYRTINPLSAHHTLCAAYVSQNNFMAATKACDKAVEFARQFGHTLNRPGRKTRERVERALANRAVLERALERETSQGIEIVSVAGRSQKN